MSSVSLGSGKAGKVGNDFDRQSKKRSDMRGGLKNLGRHESVAGIGKRVPSRRGTNERIVCSGVEKMEIKWRDVW